MTDLDRLDAPTTVDVRSPSNNAVPKKVLHPRRRAYRHPAEVTADRLGDHLDRWYGTTDGSLRDAIARVRAWLDQVAELP